MADRSSLDALTNICLPGIVLRSAFVAEKISVLCLNVQSLCARNMVKFDELSQIMNVSKVDVACVNETWLNNRIDTNTVQIAGYHTIRSDRVGKIGGGLLIYLKKNFTYKIIETSCVTINDHSIEFMFLELVIQDKRLLIGFFYNHPDLDCSSVLDEKMIEYGSNYDEFLLLGDFNTNLCRKSLKTERFLETLDISSD